MNSENSVGLQIEAKVDKTIQSLDKVIQNLNKTNNMLNKIASNSGFSKTNNELKQTNNLLSNMSSSLSKMSGMSNKLNLGAVIAAFNRLGRQMMKNLDASASYVENLNLMQVAFQETRDEAESFVNGLSDIFGLDESVMTRQLGYYRQIGNALAIGNEYADLLGKNLLKMQLDMSSLYNLSFKRSGEVLQASMAGQTKPIRGSTGADITQSTLQTDLDRLGIDRAVTDLSRAEKSILIYLSLERQLAASQGDLAKTINSTANQQKIFTEQTNRLSRAFGDVLTPAFTKVLTVANGFLMVIVELIEMFAKFVGFEIPEYDADSYGLPDYFDDVGTSADKANKQLLGLRGFDKLNDIKTPNKNDSGAGGSIGGVDQRLLDALKEYDLKMDGIQNKATQIRDTIMEWLGFTKEVNAATGEITWKYDTLGKSAEQIAKEIGANLGKKLTEFTNSLDWEKYGKTIANGLNIALSFVNSFIDSYSFVELGKGIGKRFNAVFENLDWNALGKALTNKFKIMIETLYGFVKTLDWGKLGKGIGESINGAIENLSLTDVAKTLNKLINGIFKALIEAIKTVDWGNAFKNIIYGFDKLNPLIKVFIGYKLASTITNIGTSIKKATAGGTLTNVSKLTKAFIGAEGLATAILLTNDAIKDMIVNGATLSNTLEGLGGLATSFATGFMTFGAKGGLISVALTEAGTLYNFLKDSYNEYENLKQQVNDLNISYDNFVQHVGDARVSFESLKGEIDKSIQSTLLNLNYADKTVESLQGLIDENGKVVGSTEDVQLKLDILNEALGTEYKLVDGVITENGKKVKSYDDLKKGVEKYIEKLKTEIYLEAYKEKAIEATKKMIDLQEANNTVLDKLNKRRERIKTNEEELQTLWDKSGGVITNLSYSERRRWEELNSQLQQDKLEVDNLNGAYNRNAKEIQGYEKVIDTYTQAATENAKGNSQNALDIITGKQKAAVNSIKDFTQQTVNLLPDILKKKDLSLNVKTKVDSSAVDSLVKKLSKNTLTAPIAAMIQRIVKIKAFANGGFPEDGWFRASKGEYFGKFDDGTSYIANNKQITDGIRQATTNGMMDAFAMQMNSGNKQNINVTIVAEDDGILNAIKFKEKSKDRQYGL